MSPLTRQNWYGQDPVLGHALACWHLGGRRRKRRGRKKKKRDV
jgi:hypothetical protein